MNFFNSGIDNRLNGSFCLVSFFSGIDMSFTLPSEPLIPAADYEESQIHYTEGTQNLIIRTWLNDNLFIVATRFPVLASITMAGTFFM